MSKEKRIQGTASEIERLEQHYLVGREKEISLFLNIMANHRPEERILNLYGTGGVGKSYLLDEFLRLAENAGIPALYLDSHACSRNPLEFCLHLLHLLHYSPSRFGKRHTDIHSLKKLVLLEIEKAAGKGKLLLALDTFEEIGEMEHWLRDEFLAYLSPNVLTIISGRFPLQGQWLTSPAWRRLIVHIPVTDLSYEAVKRYLERSGMEKDEQALSVWTRTKGHPLTLSLFVSTTLARTLPRSARASSEDIFPYVVKVWLKEVPQREIREMVEATAVLRHFNQELLSFVLEKPVSSEQFIELIGHSFIRRVDHGWILHDMLRDAIGHEMRLRTPDFYDKLWKRCIMHYDLRMRQSPAKIALPWGNADWVYYIGDRLIRTLFYQQSVSYQLESLDRSNWAEALNYYEHRFSNIREVRILPTDLETNESYEYVISAEEGLYGFKHVDLKELYELDPNIVKLIRDELGTVCGMAVIVPIHEGTMDYLYSRPPSSTYFASLPESKLRELRTSKDAHAGYFIEMIDVSDYADLSMRQAAGLTFISYMLSARLVVTTAPSIPFFHAIFQSLGFEQAKDIVHFDYDDQIPTPYFVLDTRGNKLHDYLDRMISSFGLAQVRDDANKGKQLLSRRERDVAELLIQGNSNMEIAGLLYVSEATVKKHVSNIFKKYHVKNRVQFIHRYNEPFSRQ